MKTSARFLFLSATIAFYLALTPVIFAQDSQQPDPALLPVPAEKSPSAVAPTPVDITSAPGADAKTGSQITQAEPNLRRLSEPPTPVDPKPTRQARPSRRARNTGNEIVNLGSDSYLGKGQNAGSVIAVFGSATSEGEVADQVISVFGNTRITGTVGDQAVAVFGNIYVNGKVADQVIAVFGNVELGPDADVTHVVAIGGRVTRDPKAIVRGQVNNVSFGGAFTDFGWLQAWIQNCAFYLRPLAFAPGLMWAWWIAVGFLAFYVLLALLFGKGVNRCVVTLEQRPS
ncbi:MAG: hypothetical protein ABI222_04365, partial [Opitutaceae bacterium]